jgi:hypothetical protein
MSMGVAPAETSPALGVVIDPMRAIVSNKAACDQGNPGE